MLNGSRARRFVASAFAAVAFSSVASAADAPSADDLARAFAGLPPSAGSPLQALTKDASWKRHAQFFDRAWQRLDKDQLSKIRSWSGRKLSDPQPVVFYMFSGPDFLYVDTFFDKADTYVLSGLEPVGQVANLAALPSGAVARDLQELRGSLSSILTHSFFKTKSMKNDLRTSYSSGTLPILYTFLARTGHAVRDMSYVELDDQGNLQPGGAASSKSQAKGVKIT